MSPSHTDYIPICCLIILQLIVTMLMAPSCTEGCNKIIKYWNWFWLAWISVFIWPLNSYMLFFLLVPSWATKGHLGQHFKLPFLATYSWQIEFLTTLYDINRGIKWGWGWSQNLILTTRSMLFSKMHFFWTNKFKWQKNQETTLHSNRDTKSSSFCISMNK